MPNRHWQAQCFGDKVRIHNINGMMDIHTWLAVTDTSRPYRIELKRWASPYTFWSQQLESETFYATDTKALHKWLSNNFKNRRYQPTKRVRALLKIMFENTFPTKPCPLTFVRYQDQIMQLSGQLTYRAWNGRDNRPFVSIHIPDATERSYIRDALILCKTYRDRYTTIETGLDSFRIISYIDGSSEFVATPIIRKEY